MGKQVVASHKCPWLGIVVGALVGGIGQYLIVVLFLYYVFNWGGLFFRNHVGVSLPALASSYPAWIFLGLAAGLGGIGGALGGTTRRLATGALLSSGTIGLVYLTLVVVPLNRMIELSGGNVTDTRAVALSLVATVAWGAIAGSSGAAVNKRLTQS